MKSSSVTELHSRYKSHMSLEVFRARLIAFATDLGITKKTWEAMYPPRDEDSSNKRQGALSARDEFVNSYQTADPADFIVDAAALSCKRTHLDFYDYTVGLQKLA